MKTLQDVEDELVALRLGFEYIVAPLIATHPQRTKLLELMRLYRRQVVASTDRTKQSLAELLDRVDAAVRVIPADTGDS